MRIAIGLISILLYAAGTVLVGRHLYAGSRGQAAPRAGMAWTVMAALTAHAALIYQVASGGGAMELGNVASLMGWVIVLLVVITTTVRPVDDLGVFVLPLAAATVTASLFGWDAQRLVAAHGLGIRLHVVVSILAYGLLTIAAFQALVLAYQDRQLRHKRPFGLLRALPPLQAQEQLLFQLVGLGFFLLSLSLASGFMFVTDMFAQHLAHKTILSVAAWTLFALLLWGRWQYGWRGGRAVRLSLAGFGVLALAYFGSKIVLELFLDRTWY